MIRLRWPWGKKRDAPQRHGLSGRGVVQGRGRDPCGTRQDACDYPHCEMRWKGRCDRSRLGP
jgi:hypothetical protein